MLQTDEVDDDYFTPTSSTTLANIFGGASTSFNSAENIENESLKYSPSKGRSFISKPESTLKNTECIFACALFAYEWFENKYLSKGKLGFAITKDIKSNEHDIILYDSSKTSLSRTTVTTKLQVTVKENVYMSYYDNSSKYWTIHATEQELQNISALLKTLNVIIKYCHGGGDNEGPPEPHKIEQKQLAQQKLPSDKESDTDSSVNRKTKNSILSRMASMGQSVLPRKTALAEKTSDSSDNDLEECNSKTTRHKPIKCIVKRINTDKVVPEVSTNIITSHTGNILNTTPLYGHSTGQIMLLDNNTSSGIHTGSGNELNLVLAEQRISNSELRINVNRINDKMDQVLEKIKDFTHKEGNNISSSNFHMDILQKLMTEYETKIKKYEQLVSTIDLKTELPCKMESQTNKSEELEASHSKIMELQEIIGEKNKIISALYEEINMIKKLSSEKALISANTIECLTKEIEQLKQILVSKEQEIANMAKERDRTALASSESNNVDIGSKIKIIMNDTFKTIATNFENDTTYSGDTIKFIVASVLKKVTIDSLKEK